MKITQSKSKQAPLFPSNSLRKKSSLFLLATVASSLISSKVFAAEKLKFYGGIEALSQTTNFELRDNSSSVSSDAVYSNREKSASRTVPAIFAGLDNGANSRFELGLNQVRYSSHEQPYGRNVNDIYQIDTRSLTKSYKFSATNFNLDYKPYLVAGKGFQIEGLLGLSYQKVKLNFSENYSSRNQTLLPSSSYRQNFEYSSTSKTTQFVAPSIGAGARYEITKDFFLRTQLRYTYLNKTILSTKLKSTTQISLGVGYNF